MRVLLVEDCEETRAGLALVLRAWGHDVHLAADGPSALESSQRVRPQVVVLDINLPGMSGWEVGRQLRQQSNGTLLLIALTGYDGAQDRARSLDAGFNAHLTKPADLRKIRRLLTMAAEEVPEQIAAQVEEGVEQMRKALRPFKQARPDANGPDR